MIGAAGATVPHPRSSSAHRRWLELLARLDVESMTARFITQVVALPDYRAGAVPQQELRRTAVNTFGTLVRSLQRGEDDRAARDSRLEIATELGVMRARANVPVESLVSAIRLDFTVLWHELSTVAEPADAPVLVEYANLVWNVVDSFASQTRVTYLAERQRMSDEASSRRQDYVATIFAELPPATEQLRHVAARLGIPPEAEIGVAAAMGDDVPAVRRVIASTELLGGELFTHPIGGGLVVFWVYDPRPGSAVTNAVEQLHKLRCGLIERAHGLAQLPATARLAQDLAALLGPKDQQALSLTNSWARIARDRLRATGLPLAGDVAAALADCAEAERERLEEAVLTYLRTGSVSACAEQLFCHRNTVMNRLRRFRELTGIDVTVPAETARLVIAWT